MSARNSFKKCIECKTEENSNTFQYSNKYPACLTRLRPQSESDLIEVHNTMIKNLINQIIKKDEQKPSPIVKL